MEANHRPTRALLGLVVLVGLGLTATACGTAGSEPARDVVASTTTLAVERPTAPVDGQFDVDGVGFHLHCTGEGDTTVLLIAGWGSGGDESWALVHPALADHARVCTYDRPGTGTSDAPAHTQTFRTQAADLRSLLDVAGEAGPYVVVGHSFGGAVAATFAADVRDEVAGLVLVDASPATWPAAVCAVTDDGSEAAAGYRQLCEVFHDPTQDLERLDVVGGFDEVAALPSFGELPMTVITAAERTAPGLAPADLRRLDEVWDDGVATWAALSSASSVVTVSETGHAIQLEHPDLVVRAVRALLEPCTETETLPCDS